MHFLAMKLHESVGRTDIVALGAYALHLFLLVYLQAEESKNALALWQLLYLPGDVVNGIRDALRILITDDTLHLLHLPIYLRLDELQVCLSVVAVRNNDSRLLVVPFDRKNMIVGTVPAQTALVNEVIIQCAFLSRHRG